MSDPMFTTLRTERNTALATPQLAPLTARLHGTDETADLLKRLIALTRRHLYR